MSNESIIYLVAACSGVFGLAAYVGLILVPGLDGLQPRLGAHGRGLPHASTCWPRS